MAERAAAYGGHDFDFVDKIPDRLNCQICTKVLCEPHLAVCCGQHFCESCLNKWLVCEGLSKQSCPHCRAEGEGFNHVINKGLRSEINQLKIRCSNCREGCQWTGELGALKAHLESESGCGYVMVKCPNKCIILAGTTCTVLRKDIKKHLAQDCYLRPYACEFCGLKDTYEAIVGVSYLIPDSLSGNDYFGHQATCLEAPLTCPNKCGSENIKRKDMDSHHSECPNEHMECPFTEAGCKGVILRCQLQDHMTSNIQQHLMMVMKDCKETKNKLAKAQTELVETKQELKDALERLSVVEQHLDYKLEKSGDSIKLQMPKFSEYRRSGKVWHSPPFYYREGYKMCLAVYANGVGEGAGTHVSLSLLLLKGKYDDQLKWPMKFCSCRRHAVPTVSEGTKIFIVCCNHCQQSANEHNDNNIMQIDHSDYFCSLKKKALVLVNDFLTFAVEFGECYVKVRIQRN